MNPEEVQLHAQLQIITTGEPVVVLDSGPNGTFLLRRPVQSQAHGINHVQEYFHASELETPSQAMRREMDAIAERQRYMMQVEANLQKQSSPIVHPN